MKAVIIILILVCAGFGYGLFAVNKRASIETQGQKQQIEVLRKDLQDTSKKLEEQKQVNAKLDTSLTDRSAKLESASNQLEAVKADLVVALTQAGEEKRIAQTTIAQKQEKIQKLEGENQDLNTQMTGLTAAISDLENLIADTERKLAASEGDREFLLAELKRLQAEKVGLERQFNDLALLRDQIRKLKDELSMASRLEWIRRGLYGPAPEGAEKLQPGFAAPALGEESVDLEVEIRQDGDARVVSTNAPVATP